MHFGGTPRHALGAAVDHFRIACCDCIRSEVHKTLSLKFGWTHDRVTVEMWRFLGNLPDAIVPGRLQGVCRDPNDDKILECAVLARAKIILTGDKNLLVLGEYAGIKILSIRDFLNRAGLA